MQFPESWLREFCNPPLDTQQLADALTMAGLEVEELAPVAPAFSGVVVGEILSTEQHPDADRLRVCQVSIGEPEPLTIVCGAPNARPGIRVPCATVGALLPPGADGKPFQIKVGKLRGVESHGMLCSHTELGIDIDAPDGLYELAADAPVGQDIRAYLNLDDQLFTLKLTPNLAHCLSVYGVAQELSAITGAPLKQPTINPIQAQHDQRLPVTIAAPDLCGRFAGRIVRGINPTAVTPDWMVARLARCGQRAVAPLVDISNYVMFELGRPSHIFDLDKIHGGLTVRWGKAGESLKLLNGNTVTLDENVGVIADEVAVESLAGIMGGDATAVTDDTQNVYIEAAFWWPESIAGRSRRFNFSTDAGHRFERGVDASTVVTHIERITDLVLAICGGEAGPIEDNQVNVPTNPAVQLRVSRASKIIGMPVTQTQCVEALTRLGMQVAVVDADTLSVTAPPNRFDIKIEEDLVEEVVRMVGFENLPHTPPLAPITPQVRSESRRGAYALRHRLAALGYFETINYSFVETRWENELAGNPDPVRLLNPIASHMDVMRSSLLGNLVQVLKFNLDRRAQRVNVFELGRVFKKNPAITDTDTTVAGFDQPMRIAGLAFGPRQPTQWSVKDADADFYDVKADVEALLAPHTGTFKPAQHPAMHPGRCAEIFVDGASVGFVGELHPQWRQSYDLPKAPVMFELSLDALLARQLPHATPVPKRQRVERDLAVWVDEGVTHDQVIHASTATPTGGLLKQVTLFDIYRPKAADGAPAPTRKSLAIRLVMGSDEVTLTDEQTEQVVASVLKSLHDQLGAELRA
ncbi:MAG: phenylalanine--tRNA ligase subunit beta [Burkholderiaceae bacterium]